MFSKPKPTSNPEASNTASPLNKKLSPSMANLGASSSSSLERKTQSVFAPTEAASAPKKTPAAPSIISSDMHINGNLKSDGDLQIEGTIKGDVRANTLIIGEPAKVKGEISADDITINGTVSGCVRGLKVRLLETARVDGDIIHKAISIETGAHFEGTVQRAEDPFNHAKKTASKPKENPKSPNS